MFLYFTVLWDVSCNAFLLTFWRFQERKKYTVLNKRQRLDFQTITRKEITMVVQKVLNSTQKETEKQFLSIFHWCTWFKALESNQGRKMHPGSLKSHSQYKRSPYYFKNGDYPGGIWVRDTGRSHNFFYIEELYIIINWIDMTRYFPYFLVVVIQFIIFNQPLRLGRIWHKLNF